MNWVLEEAVEFFPFLGTTYKISGGKEPASGGGCGLVAHGSIKSVRSTNGASVRAVPRK